MNYRPEIDGLRAIAVVPVILFHAGFKLFSGGFVGVDVFFVISGFLITGIILSEIENGKFSIVNFYERRAKRILPVLFLVMLTCIPFAWTMLFPHDLISFSKSLISTSVFLSNILFWSERGYFGSATELKPLIHTWSLSIEEQYYLFFPLLLLLLSKKNTQRNVILIIVFIVSFVLCVWLTPIHQDSAFFLLPTRFWELLVGSFTAIIYYNIEKNNKNLNTKTENYLSIVGIFLIVYSIFNFDKNTNFPGYTALMPVIGSAMVLLCANKNTLVGNCLGKRVFVFIGLLSYSAYLWHQPIFTFYRLGNYDQSLIFFITLIVFTFILSYLSWKYIEQPFRKATIKTINVFMLTSFFIVFFIIVGCLGVSNNGYAERFSKNDREIFNNFINPGEYVSKKFDSKVLTGFNLNDKKKKKIVLIGDSFGKDILNAVYESSVYDSVEISTYQINSECGNLYLKTDFSNNIDPSKLPRCKTMGWYENEKLKRLINEADQLWLASSWSMWVAEYLPESINNLERDFGKPVLVFGTKNFGDVSLKSLISIPYNQRQNYYSTIDIQSFNVQSFMRNKLSSKNYIDVGNLLCGYDYTNCRWFNQKSEPLSFDGKHLTKAGAEFLGKSLQFNNLLFLHIQNK